MSIGNFRLGRMRSICQKFHSREPREAWPLKISHGTGDKDFSGIPFIPENFKWNEPKSRVPFTLQPEFLEFFGKWKIENAPG